MCCGQCVNVSHHFSALRTRVGCRLYMLWISLKREVVLQSSLAGVLRHRAVGWYLLPVIWGGLAMLWYGEVRLLVSILIRSEAHYSCHVKRL